MAGIILLLAIVLYIKKENYGIDCPVWFEILLKLYDLVVIGAIWGVVVDVTQTLGVFKRELQNIIHAKEFLGERKDVEQIWENASTVLFNDRFKGINKDLLKAIKGYLPQDEVNYYSEHDTVITIKWRNKDGGKSGFIEAKWIVSFNLVAEYSKEFTHPIKVWVPKETTYSYTTKITEVKVNGKVVDGEDVEMEDEKIEGMKCIGRILTLSGKKTYQIRFTRESVYHLDDDNTIGFSSRYIVNKLTARLKYPEELKVSFNGRGTLNKFKEGTGNGEGEVYKRYDDVMLPNQGYIFVLKRKPLG